MTDETAEFFTLSDLQSLDDANRMAFRIETRTGAGIRISVAIDEVPAIISYLAAGATHIRLSKRELDSEAAASPKAGLTLLADAIPASGAGFAMAGNPDQVYLVIHLAPKLNLAFEIPRTQLAAVAKHLSRTAQTLSADHTKKN
jgi:hypothetical protein